MDKTVYRLLRLSHTVKQWIFNQLTPSGLGVLGCLILFGLIGLDIQRSLSYQIFAFLLMLLIVAITASRCSRPRIRAIRHLPRFGTVGVPLQYRVSLFNQSRKRQPGLTLRETFTDTFPSFKAFQAVMKTDKSPSLRRRAWLRLLSWRQWAIAGAIALPPLVANGETEVLVEITPLRRGRLPLNQLMIACPDPLGLVNRTLTLSLFQSVLILPKRYQFPAIELPGARHYQASGLALAASVGDSEEFRALREYRPGDPPRKIHWKSWAKIGRPVIKEEQSEYSVRYALILDTFLETPHLDDNCEVMEEAVAIAASLACAIQTDGQSQESLLDTVFVGFEAHCFTVGRGLGHTERLLELLAVVTPCDDQPFSTLLPVVQARLSLLSGCICILLGWDRDRQALVEQLQAAGVPTLVLVLAGAQGLAEDPDRGCLQVPQSSLHVLRVGEIQAGLWAL